MSGLSRKGSVYKTHVRFNKKDNAKLISADKKLANWKIAEEASPRLTLFKNIFNLKSLSESGEP